MSVVNGFQMSSTSSRRTRLVEDSSQSSAEEPAKKQKIHVSESEPETDEEEEVTVLTHYDEFSRVYKDIVQMVFKKQIGTPTMKVWETFISKVKELNKKGEIPLMVLTIHVLCNEYALANGLTKAKWERHDKMAAWYRNGQLPTYKPMEISTFTFTDEEKEELTALTYLKSFGIHSSELAMVLQRKCMDAGFDGLMSSKDQAWLVYENTVSFDMFSRDAAFEFLKGLFPATDAQENDSDQPVQWQKDVFDPDLSDKIQKTNAKDLSFKLRIRAIDSDFNAFCTTVRTEIAMKCGRTYVNENPNIQRNEMGRPIYSRKNLQKMKLVYTKVLKDLNLF